MRNVIILGASALVLALGVAQASASQSNSVLDYRTANESSQPAYVGELRDAGATSADPYASQYQLPFDANQRHAGH